MLAPLMPFALRRLFEFHEPRPGFAQVLEIELC